ncbi:MAG: heme exporter protein CcmD [Magnetococcales bacterium]|nr:heme exporter protein CcmD [Magnetococcales bacterium]
MSDYTLYVVAAYGIALLLYGGLTLHWQTQRRRLQRRLQNEDKGGEHG